MLSGFLCRGSVCDAAEIESSSFPLAEQRSLAHLPHSVASLCAGAIEYKYSSNKEVRDSSTENKRMQRVRVCDYREKDGGVTNQFTLYF